MSHFLITGGTGLVGSALTAMLRREGHTVSYLSRRAKKADGIVHYAWDPAAGLLDEEALTQADYVIHLAGANVGDKPWTAARKQEILDSRTQGTALLNQKLRTVPHRIQAVIAATAIGIYGDRGEQTVHEDTEPGRGFLAAVCVEWEKGLDELASVTRLVRLRVGVVLAREGGALPKMAQPVRMFAGAALGSGRQYISWIHLEDLCRLFVLAATDTRWHGNYNAVAPNPVTNAQLTRHIADTLQRPLLLPPVPAFVLRLMLGEMADIVLEGQRVSAQKVLDTGFRFKYPAASEAVQSLLP